MRDVGSGFWEGGDSDSSKKADARWNPSSGTAGRQSVLLRLVQEIEPLDVRHVSRDASAVSMDAMKRTVSGMLGLLPAGQFHVSVAAGRDAIARLLVSSMMTGYTLRNAEYRMCLQKALELPDARALASGEDTWRQAPTAATSSSEERGEGPDGGAREGPQPPSGAPIAGEGGPGVGDAAVGPCLQISGGLGGLSPAARAYIQRLQTQLAAVSQDLEEHKRQLASAEVGMVGEEQNDLLGYLRNLDPEKVRGSSRAARLRARRPLLSLGRGQDEARGWRQEMSSLLLWCMSSLLLWCCPNASATGPKPQTPYTTKARNLNRARFCRLARLRGPLWLQPFFSLLELSDFRFECQNMLS